MQQIFELLITVVLAAAGLGGVYWLITLLKGKLPEPGFVISLVVFVVLGIVVIYYVAFHGFRIIKL